jgi:DNA-binding GntR family transcriptional regulator
MLPPGADGERSIERILDGRIPADHKLWSQIDLAGLLQVSRGTTIRAYEDLQKTGLRVPGRGIFSAMADEIEAVRQKLKR